MKYSMFIGRWQPFHDGHKWLINERLKLGKNVLSAISNMKESNASLMAKVWVRLARSS